MIARPWLWPDHSIGKRDSRGLREDHNATVNQHAEMLELLQRAMTLRRTPSALGWTVKEHKRSWEAWEIEARTLIENAGGKP